MKIIKSKFRRGYFAGIVFVTFALLIMIISLIVFLSNRVIDFRELGVWVVFSMIFILIYLLFLIPFDFEEIRIDIDGIRVRNIVKRKTDFIAFESVVKHYIQRSVSYSDGGQINDGYNILCLELEDGRILTISQHTYTNFLEIKSFIYSQLYLTPTTP